jgi:uncharacterized protein
MINIKSIISSTHEYVQESLSSAEGGHDYWHTYRVWQNAIRIQKIEGGNPTIIELASLLHDIADSKFHNGDETIGPRIAREFLTSQNCEDSIIDHVVKIIENISFKGGHKNSDFNSLELQVVQDADRLEAIGAIGIARTFNYGGHKGSLLFDPNHSPQLNMSKEEYKKGGAPTINHFYEKLLLLKDLMNTNTGQAMADQRHEFMLSFLRQFYQEASFASEGTPFAL